MYMTGMRRSDVFQNMMTYGLFTGGLGFHYGAEKVGALIIPAGSGNSKRQIQLMQDFGTTAIHVIPSYALHLTSVFEEVGVDPRRDTKLAIAFLGAEPHSEKTRKKIEEFYGLKAFNSYGLSEMDGPGVAFECPNQMGMHVWEDNFIMEIIDPDTLEPVPEGEEGELVMTTLLRGGMPILRYRTKDLTRIVPGPCECGRVHRRIERIKGRTDDMLILKGVNIFPIQIEKRLMDIPGVGTNFLIILEREGFNDLMIVRVEVGKEFFSGDLKQLEALRRRIVEELRSDILITPKVELVEPGTLPKSEGKAVRVIDNREE
jgi:phenylacetate-CoA ligase